MHEHCGHQNLPQSKSPKGAFDTMVELKGRLRELANPQTAEQMLREGYLYKVNLGVSPDALRPLAQPHANNHELALMLYRDDMRECKLLAALVDTPLAVTDAQMDEWARDFNNPEIIDFVCLNLFGMSRLALARSYEWCISDNELLQRAGLMMFGYNAASSAVETVVLEPYIGIVEDIAETASELMRGAMVYALRQMSEHSNHLREQVRQCAQRLVAAKNPIAQSVGKELIG